MDIEYWIDYLEKFGVSHKIPLYDNMSTFKYYNMEIWIPVSLVILLICYLIRKCFRCICGSSKKV